MSYRCRARVRGRLYEIHGGKKNKIEESRCLVGQKILFSSHSLILSHKGNLLPPSPLSYNRPFWFLTISFNSLSNPYQKSQ